MPAILSTILAAVVSIGSKLLFAIIVLLVGHLLIKLLVKTIGRSKAYAHIDPEMRSFLDSLLKTALYIVLIITVVPILGIEIASIITVLATAGALGAYLVKGHDAMHVASVPVERVYTPKGAGDSFLAAYLYAKYERGMDEKKSMNAAARVASKKIATQGGKYPDLSTAIG